MEKRNSLLFLFVLLGALTAFGPFVTDMYLPSFPSMVHYFQTSSSMVQLGLTTSMIGLAVGQLFFGPISDKYGRRLPLLGAILLFIVSTVGCIFAPSIEVFLFLRLIQGIAGAGGIVIARSVATDSFSNKDLGKAMAIIGAINGVAPVAAPVAGGFLTDTVGWRGIFVILLLIGILLLFGILRFHESLPVNMRRSVRWLDLIFSFGHVLKNRAYVCYVLQMGFAMGVLFANISSSPFIVQEHYGFSAVMFSVVFGLNSLAIGVAAGLSVKFKSPENVTLAGCTGMVVFAAMECFALNTNCDFWVYEGLLVGLLFMMGLTFTSSTTLAMALARENSGTASALLGAAGFAFGGLVSPLVSLGDILSGTGAIFLICSFCSLLCVLWALRPSGIYLKQLLFRWIPFRH